MAQQPQTQAVQPTTTYARGDFVLFRDADKFWAGQPAHTFVCRVTDVCQADAVRRRYELVSLTTYSVIRSAAPEYMRLLPPADAMHDIDTAPLSEPDTGAMTPAAVAWLRQYLVQDGARATARR